MRTMFLVFFLAAFAVAGMTPAFAGAPLEVVDVKLEFPTNDDETDERNIRLPGENSA